MSFCVIYMRYIFIYSVIAIFQFLLRASYSKQVKLKWAPYQRDPQMTPGEFPNLVRNPNTNSKYCIFSIRRLFIWSVIKICWIVFEKCCGQHGSERNGANTVYPLFRWGIINRHFQRFRTVTTCRQNFEQCRNTGFKLKYPSAIGIKYINLQFS